MPVLEKLFELYPHLFGSEFLPLKLGVFQELMARHPGDFQKEDLKLALGVHTRSTRYLQCIAARKKRHDLDGNAVDDVSPEHVYLALLELFRRRQGRSPENLLPKLRNQLIAAYEASGLTPHEYVARVQSADAEATTFLTEALGEHAQTLARREALVKAFKTSGKTPAEFADMYGIDPRDLQRAIG